jgi:hypothetical protein
MEFLVGRMYHYVVKAVVPGALRVAKHLPHSCFTYISSSVQMRVVTSEE